MIYMLMMSIFIFEENPQKLVNDQFQIFGANKACITYFIRNFMSMYHPESNQSPKLRSNIPE